MLHGNKKMFTTASQWMSDWYWQNQQFAHLNRWQQQNLTNIWK